MKIRTAVPNSSTRSRQLLIRRRARASPQATAGVSTPPGKGSSCGGWRRLGWHSREGFDVEGGCLDSKGGEWEVKCEIRPKVWEHVAGCCRTSTAITAQVVRGWKKMDSASAGPCAYAMLPLASYDSAAGL